jgi:hypothetical protein
LSNEYDHPQKSKVNFYPKINNFQPQNRTFMNISCKKYERNGRKNLLRVFTAGKKPEKRLLEHENTAVSTTKYIFPSKTQKGGGVYVKLHNSPRPQPSQNRILGKYKLHN